MDIITKDMYLSAILISYGCKITSVDKQDAKKQYFHFDRIPAQVITSDDNGLPVVTEVKDLSEIQSLYLSRRIFFPPNFVDCLRAMKSHIYSE